MWESTCSLAKKEEMEFVVNTQPHTQLNDTNYLEKAARFVFWAEDSWIWL